MEDGRTEAHDAHSDEYGKVIIGEGKKQEAGQREAHAYGKGVGARMAVGIQSGERLQDGRGHLKDERDESDLCEREVEISLQNGIY